MCAPREGCHILSSHRRREQQQVQAKQPRTPCTRVNQEARSRANLINKSCIRFGAFFVRVPRRRMTGSRWRPTYKIELRLRVSPMTTECRSGLPPPTTDLKARNDPLQARMHQEARMTRATLMRVARETLSQFENVPLDAVRQTMSFRE